MRTAGKARYTRSQLFGVVAVTALLTSAVVGGGLVLAGAGPAPNKYYACAKNNAVSGAIKVNSKPTCPAGQKLVVWNQAGAKGAKGATGTAGATGVTGSRGPSDAWSADNDSFTSSSGAAIPVSLSLPAGSYVVNWSIFAELTSGTSALVGCQVGAGAYGQSLVSATGTTTLSGTGILTLATAGTASLGCGSVQDFGGVASITAIQVASAH